MDSGPFDGTLPCTWVAFGAKTDARIDAVVAPERCAVARSHPQVDPVAAAARVVAWLITGTGHFYPSFAVAAVVYQAQIASAASASAEG